MAPENPLVLASEYLRDFLRGHVSFLYEDVSQRNVPAPSVKRRLNPQALMQMTFFDEPAANSRFAEKEPPFPLRALLPQSLHSVLVFDDARPAIFIEQATLGQNVAHRTGIAALLLFDSPSHSLLVDQTELNSNRSEKRLLLGTFHTA